MMIRQAESNDLSLIASTHVRELGRQIDTRRLDAALNRYPSVIAEQQGRMIGFAFSSPISSDILQLTQIMIARSWRGQGYGTEMLGALEVLATGRYQALVVAAPSSGDKKPGTEAFFAQAGYREMLTTGSARLLAKQLSVNRSGNED